MSIFDIPILIGIIFYIWNTDGLVPKAFNVILVFDQDRVKQVRLNAPMAYTFVVIVVVFKIYLYINTLDNCKVVYLLDL